jgi:hypothetical protein
MDAALDRGAEVRPGRPGRIRSASSPSTPPERWAEDVSEDIASEVMLRVYRAVGELPSSLEAFIDQHLGPDRQLTLRLA